MSSLDTFTLDKSASGGAGGSGTGFTNLIVKSVDETKNNDNILADDLELSVPVVASSVYFFEFILVFDSAALADLKYAFSLPGDVTNNKKLASSWQSTGQALTNSTTTSQFIATTPQPKIIQGTGVFTTVSAGTFALQWAQNTSDAGNTIMKAGSILKVMKQQ